ncbi:MAG TPA: hypothetical protein VGN20_28900 [Mucilaginibacter sp.]
MSLVLKAQTINEGLKGSSFAQPQPFLFTVTTLNPAARQWSLNYSGGYGQNTATPFGFDGVDQNISVLGYLGARTTLLASMGVGFGNNGYVQTVQQAEVLKDFIGGKKVTGFRLGTSLGVRREFSGEITALSRFNAAYESQAWKFATNIRFEKVFASDRDGLDVISTFGILKQISGRFFGGVEAVGQDLEGFWEPDEAEGGARILIGPSLNFVPQGSRLSFSVCGGPIIQATHSVIVTNDSAVRDLPLLNNGFTVKFNVGFRFL